MYKIKIIKKNLTEFVQFDREYIIWFHTKSRKAQLNLNIYNIDNAELHLRQS